MIGADDKGQLKQVFNHVRVNLISSPIELNLQPQGAVLLLVDGIVVSVVSADDKGQLTQVFNHERVNLITSPKGSETTASGRCDVTWGS